jgi:CBS domain-containing protein
LQEIVGGIPLNVKLRGQLWGQLAHICIADVSLIGPWVHRNAVGAKALNVEGPIQYGGHLPAPGIAKGGDLVDVYTEFNHGAIKAKGKKWYVCSGLISTDAMLELLPIPFILPEDNPAAALRKMRELRLRHLPLVRQGKYAGLISEDQLEQAGNELPTPQVFYALGPTSHMMDALRIMGAETISVLPVVDPDSGAILGGVTIHMVMRNFGNSTGIQQAGSILVIEMSPRNYHLGEIVQIIEAHDGKILTMLADQPPGQDVFHVTFKISLEDLDPIVQALERYSYVIVAAHHKSLFNLDLKDRFEILMKYLDL